LIADDTYLFRNFAFPEETYSFYVLINAINFAALQIWKIVKLFEVFLDQQKMTTIAILGNIPFNIIILVAQFFQFAILFFFEIQIYRSSMHHDNSAYVLLVEESVIHTFCNYSLLFPEFLNYTSRISSLGRVDVKRNNSWLLNIRNYLT
jgi:hypothetical protein